MSEKMKTAFLLNILPNVLRRRVYEHIDRLTLYGDFGDEIVALIHSRSPDDMGVGNVDQAAAERWGGDWEYLAEEDADIGALGRGLQCHRCGGNGQYARDCSTLKGKGKGGEGGRVKAKGKSARIARRRGTRWRAVRPCTPS